MFTITVQGSGLEKFQRAAEALGDAKARRAYSMGLNKTIARVNTQTKRAVAHQMGTTQSAVVRHGGWRVIKAWSGNLEASVESTGAHLPLKDFKPGQRKKGVSANPWNTRRIFGGTWLDRNGKAGGHVFRRNGKFNNKSGRLNGIEALWGPAAPKELVRDESKAAFENISGSVLPAEVERAIKVLTKGVVS